MGRPWQSFLPKYYREFESWEMQFEINPRFWQKAIRYSADMRRAPARKNIHYMALSLSKYVNREAMEFDAGVRPEWGAYIHYIACQAMLAGRQWNLEEGSGRTGSHILLYMICGNIIYNDVIWPIRRSPANSCVSFIVKLNFNRQRKLHFSSMSKNE